MNVFKELTLLNGNSKGMFFLLFFRTSSYFTTNKFLKIIGFPIRVMYKVIVQWILGIDIFDFTKIGEGFNVYHGQGLVINGSTIIGKNVVVRHNTTIGNAKQKGGSPIIGDNVEIGANSVILGEIVIGSNSIVGAGSVVIKNVPSYSLVVGNPAKVVRDLTP